MEVAIMKKDIFISYSNDDLSKETANRIYDNFTKKGLNVWFNQKDLKPGVKWEDEIRKAIKNASYFIVIISNNTPEKENFNYELKNALKHNKKIIPVLTNDAFQNDIPDPISDIYPIKISGDDNSIESLYNAIELNKSTWEKIREYIIND